MTTLRHVTTPLLEMAYEDNGPPQGLPVLLIHGWPDDVRTYDDILPALHDGGFRTIVPWLRGFGPTRFRSSSTLRSGQIVAMAQDIVDFADALGLERLRIVGHDWGSRIAYVLAAIIPDRVQQIVTMSAGWDPGRFKTPALFQAHNFWYQWFMATDRGDEVVRRDGVAFARYMWQTWSPPEWFDEATFAATAHSFENPDWIDVTLHSYRVRWEEAEPDPRYADLEAHYLSVSKISVPTLLIHGGDDRCVAASTSEGKDQNFTSRYERRVIPRIGHFPTREDSSTVARWVVEWLGS